MTAGYLHRAEEVAQQLAAAAQQAALEAQQSGTLQNLVAKSTEVVEARAALCAYALWVNLNKQFKTKKIEFPEVGMTATFSKALSSMGFAFRYLFLEHHPFEDEPDMTALPIVPAAPSYSIKRWSIRQVTPLYKSVAPFPYVATTTADAHPMAPRFLFVQAAQKKQDQAPLRVLLKVPPGVIIAHAILDPDAREAFVHMPPPAAPAAPAAHPEGPAPGADDDKENRLSPAADPDADPGGPRPTVGWLDVATRQWRTDDIGEPHYDPATRTLQFATAHFCPHALLVPRAACFHSSWDIRPVAPAVALFTVVTPLCEVAIEVHPGAAVLVGPEDPELAHLLHKPFNVPYLLHQLRHAGINLLPTEADLAHITEKISVKDPAQEREFHRELSAAVAAFGATALPHNRNLGPKEFLFRIWEADLTEELALPSIALPTPRDGVGRLQMPLLQLRPRDTATDASASVSLSPRLSAPPGTFLPEVRQYLPPGYRPPMTDEGKLLTVLYERNNCRLLMYREGDANFDPSALEKNKKAHLDVVGTVKEVVTVDVIQRMEESSMLFTEAIRTLLDCVRPLSFG
ncbi:putative cancer susceptibility candidate protein 1 [Paratrimastix pyriformis]|uniref:Cancer susceptibility candidate protein 1 n=1 Tax=Paratrimastix pyriformis TaxID=342808 RepID=A0ABQ8UM48_9EUKA|nr:putative cancer susceptibility candidate protein 1 [Paratrimastix pyriformis]